MTITTRRNQTGASLLAVLYVLATLGVILVVVIKAVPVYLNNHDINAAIEQTAADPSLLHASPLEIRRAFSRRLDAGYAEGVKASDLAITSQGSQRRLSLSYDASRPLYGNVSLNFHFDDSAVLGGPQS